MSIPQPNEVKFLEGQELLQFTFTDDYVAQFRTAFLRGFCPCAQCQGHAGGPPTWTGITTPAAIRVDNVTPVGNYGLSIVWGDGHSTGIYSYEKLRSLPANPDFDPDAVEVGEKLTAFL